MKLFFWFYGEGVEKWDVGILGCWDLYADVGGV